MYRQYDMALLEAELAVVRRLRDDQVLAREGRYVRLFLGLIMVGSGLVGTALVVERIESAMIMVAAGGTGLLVGVSGLRLVVWAWSDPVGARAERILDQLEDGLVTWRERERYQVVQGEIMDGRGRIVDLAEVISLLNGGPVVAREE